MFFFHVRVALKSHGISQHGNGVEFKDKRDLITSKLKFDCDSTDLQDAHPVTR